MALVVSQALWAQRHYVCYYATQRPVIDGAGDEAVWQRARWTEDFTDIEGDVRPKPLQRTRVKMLWDSTYLYIYAELRETDLWGTLHQHDTIIYEDNDFEVFVDPENTTHRYFELEINALGTVMDLFMNKPYRNGGKALLSWDTQGLRSAVRRKGTLNHPGDVDEGWSVEMALPLNSLRFWGDRAVKDGDQWRINFSRVEWDREIKDGNYLVRTDAATGRRLPEHNWVWSPQGFIDMHMPEKWGFLQFSVRGGGPDSVAFVTPADTAVRNLLWVLYDKQQKFREQQGHYAGSLSLLGMADSGVLKMQATDVQWMALAGGSGVVLSIDQEGRVERRN